MDKNLTKEIIRVALEGEKARGNNGAVLIDTSQSDVKIVYLLSHEFGPEEFSEKLNDSLSEDGQNYIYVVNKVDKAMHISKVLRSAFSNLEF